MEVDCRGQAQKSKPGRQHNEHLDLTNEGEVGKKNNGKTKLWNMQDRYGREHYSEKRTGRSQERPLIKNGI